MELNEYQEKAMTTCMDTCNNYSYMMLNLVGEVGELASKCAKNIRKGKAVINKNHFGLNDYPDWVENDEAMQLECGDILWQLAGLCSTMGWDLETIGQKNLAKLAARKAIGTIDGNGDGVVR